MIADVVDVASLDVEVEEQGLALFVHAGGMALIDGAEVVGTGIDGEAHVCHRVCGTEPRAVEANVDLLGDEGIVGHGFDDVHEGLAGRRGGEVDRGSTAVDVVVGPR